MKRNPEAAIQDQLTETKPSGRPKNLMKGTEIGLVMLRIVDSKNDVPEDTCSSVA